MPHRGALDLFEGENLDLPHAFAGNEQLTPELLQAQRIVGEPSGLPSPPRDG
jgi:hypothetical protein